LLLACHFHQTSAVTIGLSAEPQSILTSRVPPKDQDSFEGDFTRFFIYFVKDRLLSNWDHKLDDRDGGVRADAADDRLVVLAQQLGKPLITNEGYGLNGVTDIKLRKQALDAGVAVFTPREFWLTKLDARAEIAAFFERFAIEAQHYSPYQNTRRRIEGRDYRMFEVMRGYYRHVLLGET
jgi:hypothetical protein